MSEQPSWGGFAEGEAEIWREFLDGVIPKLYALVLQRWPNRSLAEELVQKVVFDAVRARATYDNTKGSPEEWIFGIARNQIRVEIRRRSARPSVDGDIFSYVESIESKLLPDEILERQETAGIVRSALARLQARQQNVLRAKYIENLSARQISKMMDISEKAVHGLLYRARCSLRDELKRMAPQISEVQEK